MKKNIVSVCGNKNSGKTTLIKMIRDISIANQLEKDFTFENYQRNSIGWALYQNEISIDYQVLNFADALKDQIIALTGCSKKDLDSQEFKASSSKLKDIPEKFGFLYYYKYRHLLEVISDDTKKRFGPQVYVESLFNKYDPTKHLIIGDLRYSKNTSENEEGEIKKRGGIIVKLTRPNLEGDFSHSSESSIKDIEADIEHTNVELEDLFNLAKRIVEQYLK